MQRVSNEYRASMKSPLRERAYIMVSFGLVNQTALAITTTSLTLKYSEIIRKSLFMVHLRKTSRR